MISLKLQRIGKKKQPSYRIVLVEKHRDPWGKVIEILGHYHPLTKEKKLECKVDRITYWISQGAEPSNTLYNLFLKAGILKGEKKKKSVSISKKRAAKLEKKKETATASG